MKNTLIAVLLILSITGCKSVSRLFVERGGQATIITESPVTGEKLEEAPTQIEMDERLLQSCLVPMPAVDTRGKATTALEIKRAETALYYECAYRHNALVKFLDERLGIRPVTPEQIERSIRDAAEARAAESK